MNELTEAQERMLWAVFNNRRQLPHAAIIEDSGLEDDPMKATAQIMELVTHGFLSVTGKTVGHGPIYALTEKGLHALED